MKKLLVISLVMFSAASQAGSATSGALSTVHFMSGGSVLVYTSGTRSGVPSCAVNQPTRFAIDATTEGGKVQLSGLLLAYASGKNVVIHGKGHCDAYGDSETISYFYTAD